MDRPGRGLSDPRPGGPTQTSDEFKQTAHELTVDILDGLALEAAPVACTSMGGFFGLRAAIADPDRITKVVSYSWAMGSPMTNVPMMMRLGSPRPMKALMVRMPISAPAVKMMCKQGGDSLEEPARPLRTRTRLDHLRRHSNSNQTCRRAFERVIQIDPLGKFKHHLCVNEAARSAARFSICASTFSPHAPQVQQRPLS